MKKTVFILFSLFSSCIFAQEKGHYLSVSGNLGSSNFAFIDQKDYPLNNEIGYGAKIGYSFFFSRNWGIGSGVGINVYNANIKYNNPYNPTIAFNNIIDDLNTPYTRNFYFQNWKEVQSIYMIEIPILLQFNHKFNNKYFGIYANIGAKAQLPIKSSYKVNKGSIETKGYYEILGGLELEDMPNHYFEKKDNFRPEGEFNTKFGIAATASIGFNYGITRNLDLFCGAYLDYAIMDVNNGDNPKNILSVGNNYATVYNGSVNNKVIKPVSLGGELGVKYKFGKTNLETRKECKERICAEKELELEAEKLAKIEAQENARKAQEITVKVEPIRDAELNNNLKRIGDLLEKALNVQGAKAEKVVGDNNKEAVKMEFDADVLFQTGKSALSQKSKESLVKVVQIMQENPEASVDIFGHTDNVGSLEYNQRLSVNRAQAVAEYLINMGVKRSQIHRTVGKNYSEPISDNQTPEGRSKNRRVDILMYLER